MNESRIGCLYPDTKLRRRLGVALLALLAGLALATQVHVYNSAHDNPNAGVVFGPQFAHVGLEWSGDPGFFVGFGNQEREL